MNLEYYLGKYLFKFELENHLTLISLDYLNLEIFSNVERISLSSVKLFSNKKYNKNENFMQSLHLHG